jgi:sugar lactone lactonase YvrE
MRGGAAVLELVNLGSGERTLLAPVGKDGLGAEGLAWSPDSRWLFAALSDGSLVVINTVSGRPALLGPQLPPVYELAVWPAGP